MNNLSIELKHDVKKEYAELLHEQLLRRCREDPNQFIQYVMSWGTNNWIPQGPLHRKWQNTLSRPDAVRVLMLTPRSHGKTQQSIGRILWEIGRNPNLRIKIVCQSDDTAIKRLTAIIDHIERNPRVKEVFPALIPAEKGVWSKTRIYVQRHIISPDPSIEAMGILSTAVGGRADLIYFDDPVDFRNTIQQPALKQMVIDSYYDVWMNILEPDGRICLISTPWTCDDLLHKILEDPEYIKILDKIDDDFTPIWPERWNKAQLVAKHREIGTRAFSRAYKMQALSDEEALFVADTIEKCENKELSYGDLPLGIKKGVKFFIGVDLGGARTASGSYTVIFTGAEVDGIKIPVNIIRGRFKSPEFAKLLYDTNDKYRPELIYVENNSSQEAVIQWLEEIYGKSAYFPIKGYFTGMQKMSEKVGLPAMAVEFEQGNWMLPAMDHRVGCSCGYCIWIKEMKDFPLGKYSDTVMASWLFREACRSYGGRELRIWSISTGEGKRMSGMEQIIRELEDEDDDE